METDDMTTESVETPTPLPRNIKKPTSTVGAPGKEFVFDKVMFDPEVLSALQSVFNPSGQDNFDSKGFTKTACVKFMITIQDELDLHNLGYSKTQIDKLKPHEAADILQAGTKAE